MVVRAWVVVVLLVGPVACGPTIEPESGSGSGNPTQDEGESLDESGSPAPGCGGVGDTGLFGSGPIGPLGFPPPCNPSIDPGTNGYRCCSDDPAAPGGELPSYEGMDIEGSAPLFSDANNDRSNTGMCVDVTQLMGQGLFAAGVEGCPIPCNPTWSQGAIDEVCGPARECCQTVELEPPDCVMDPVSGLFRPVTGDDIPALTDWRPAAHQTHQDPNGAQCLALASGDSSSEEFLACVRALSVADQRGFCLALAPGQVCPHAEPSYVDACEQLNE